MNKKVRKIDDPEDYEKSGFKDIMDDVENTKNEALESVPQVPDEQVPTKDDTSKELLYGSNDNDNKRYESKDHLKDENNFYNTIVERSINNIE